MEQNRKSKKDKYLFLGGPEHGRFKATEPWTRVVALERIPDRRVYKKHFYVRVMLSNQKCVYVSNEIDGVERVVMIDYLSRMAVLCKK